MHEPVLGWTLQRVWAPLLGSALALCVVMLGAYVRLEDAGLGCPDWPGCYGRLTVPDSAVAAAHPSGRPLEAHKAWKEMAHRYAAGTLGLVIVGLAVAAWRRGCGRTLATALVVLVSFQGLLGMWTVTWLLKPLVVVAHLLGGLGVLALLWLMVLARAQPAAVPPGAATTVARRLAWLGLAVLGMQIALGGWTSANYAALACTGFPRCLGQWWPPMRFEGAFVLWHGLGLDYAGGILGSPARIAIHMTHRAGAALTAAVLAGTAVAAARAGARWSALALVCALVLQVGLGIANVALYLPLPVAVAHNGGAALLLLTLVTLVYLLRRSPPHV